MRLISLTGSAIALGLFSNASAQINSAEAEELQQQILILERRLELQTEVTDKKLTVKPAGDTVSARNNGFTLRSADGQYSLRFRAQLQFDHRSFLDDDRDSDTFLFRRLRPTLQGQIGRWGSFRITPEWSQDDADLVDGYIDLNLPAGLSLRAGQFKAPVSLERLQSASALHFLERSFASEVAPNRDRGVQLSTALLDKTLIVEVALTSGAADGRNATNSDGDGKREVAVRLFYEPISGIGLGIAATQGTKRGAGNAFLPRYRSPGQQTIFSYGSDVSADGDHTRLAPQAYLYKGPFGLLAEFVESTQELSRTDANGVTTAAEFSHSATAVTGVWVLTGEAASFKGVKPQDKRGAVELALRYASLDIDDDAFVEGFASASSRVSQADEIGVGLNWLLDSNVKLALNYTQTSFEGGAANGADRPDEKALFSRVQLAF